MAKRIYPSISMLPMNDIAKYLNLVHGFRKKGEIAPDTEKVAGQNSSVVAIAATDDEGSLVEDRETVKNALNLGGKSADQYLTLDKSDTLLTDTYAVGHMSSEEIKNLRDEFYQLKGELAKNGYIKNSNSYHGFQEAFRNGETKYLDNVVTRTIATENNIRVDSLTVEDTTDLLVDEYIIVANGGSESGKEYVTKITEILPDNTIKISPDIEGPVLSRSEIKKTLGMYHEGTFIFARQDDNEPKVDPDKKKYIILNDDYNETPLDPIAEDKSGYIMSFRVPKRTPGVITKLAIQAAVENNPGSLVCHIAHINTEADELRLHQMTTLDQILESGLVVGTSKPVPFSLASRSHNEIEFDFDEARGVEVKAGEKYALIIVTVNTGSVDPKSNYWSFLGVKGNGSDGDMHTNINLYRFDNHMGTTQKVGMDLWFSLTINETINKNIIHVNEGLYSTKISLPYDDFATRARVELKINREGIFNISPNPNKLVVKEGQPVELVNSEGKEYIGSIFTTNTPMVIGNQITKVGDVRRSNTYFSLGETTYTAASADAYRMGYKVFVKASHKSIDLSNELNPIKHTNKENLPPIVVELPFTAVIPGKETNKEEYSSDRLIFENIIATDEDTKMLKRYNEFEIQVYWSSNGVSETEMYNNPELAGKILDLTVALDKCYSNKNNVEEYK